MFSSDFSVTFGSGENVRMGEEKVKDEEREEGESHGKRHFRVNRLKNVNFVSHLGNLIYL